MPHGVQELCNVKPATLTVCKKLREVFVVFGYIGDAHRAALDWSQCGVVWVAHPEGRKRIKGKSSLTFVSELIVYFYVCI